METLHARNGNIVNEQDKHREVRSRRLGSERDQAFILLDSPSIAPSTSSVHSKEEPRAIRGMYKCIKVGRLKGMGWVIMPNRDQFGGQPIMDEDDRGMEQLTDIQQNTQLPAGTFPISALSEYAREWGMTCPKCQSQNAEPFMSWTISGRKMTIPQLRMWACVSPTCLHKWPRELE